MNCLIDVHEEQCSVFVIYINIFGWVVYFFIHSGIQPPEPECNISLLDFCQSINELPCTLSDSEYAFLILYEREVMYNVATWWTAETDNSQLIKILWPQVQLQTSTLRCKDSTDSNRLHPNLVITKYVGHEKWYITSNRKKLIVK